MASANLYLKHKVATSPVAGPITGLRDLFQRTRGRAHPELSLLHAEDAIMAKKLKRIVKPGMSCLEIGAHVGSVAHQLEALAGRGQVKLVEAVPEKAAWLAARFGKDNVNACAITETGEDIRFYVDHARPGFSGLTERPGSSEIPVPGRQLDALFADESFDFIKIDVEGHELAALRSGQSLLDRKRPVILFEAGPVDEQHDGTSDDLFAWLTDVMGYDIFAAFELFDRIEPLSLDRFKLYRTYPFIAFNYFAMPRQTEEAA